MSQEQWSQEQASAVERYIVEKIVPQDNALHAAVADSAAA